MAAPVSTTGSVPDPAPWVELEESFARLAELARAPITSEAFYRQLLEECARTLGATDAIAWLRAPGGSLQALVRLNLPGPAAPPDDEARREHESHLARAITDDKFLAIATPFGKTLVLTPVTLDWAPTRSTPGNTKSTEQRTLAIVELTLPGDLSPEARRAYEELMAGVREIAIDFHTRDELRRLWQQQGHGDALLQLGRVAHRSLSLAETAYTVVNEGRRLIECDRLTLLGATGRRCRLLAASGVQRVERRATTTRQLERLGDEVLRTDQVVSYRDGQADALEPIAEILEALAEASHARQIAAIPLSPPGAATHDHLEHSTTNRPAQPQEPARFVLVAEQFAACQKDLSLERLSEVAQVTSTALHSALAYDQLPFAWLLRPLATFKRSVVEHVARSTAIVVATAVAIAALLLVPADFMVEAPGTLEPVVQRDVFAPRSALVDEVLVEPGEIVTTGQALLRLHDPQLDFELSRIHGELETARRQLDAVRAARTSRAIRDSGSVESYRLSAEQRELEQELANLEAQQELLAGERQALLVTSPIEGKVLTWDLASRLIARPVERGEVLVTIADPTQAWQLELHVPDDRIGHVLAAQHALGPNLPVEFRLSSDDRERRTGEIREICLTAEVATEPQSTPAPTILVKVALPEDQLDPAQLGDLRPGVSARARIVCGERSLAYVWLHDIWDAAVTWLRF